MCLQMDAGRTSHFVGFVTRWLYYIKVIMFIANILIIFVPTCYSPKAFLSNRGTGLLILC